MNLSSFPVLADENIDSGLIKFLRDKGFDVLFYFGRGFVWFK